jgi:hypothetical protein
MTYTFDDDFTRTQQAPILDRQGYCCQDCGRRIVWARREAGDHTLLRALRPHRPRQLSARLAAGAGWSHRHLERRGSLRTLPPEPSPGRTNGRRTHVEC